MPRLAKFHKAVGLFRLKYTGKTFEVSVKLQQPTIHDEDIQRLWVRAREEHGDKVAERVSCWVEGSDTE
jgi:hypothetical protein